MPEQKKYLECEKLWVFVVLIFVAGFYGAYTMLLRGGVFCNAQTGNMVLMGMAFGQGQWSKGVYYLFPIGIYLLGVMISELIPKYVRRLDIRWDTLLIFLEIVGVIVVGFVPLTANHKISQFVIMLLCGMRYNTFRQAEGVGMATTFCTNHLRMFGSALTRALFRRRKYPGAAARALAHGAMIGSFILGAGVSGLLCQLCGGYTILFALIPLSVLLADLLYADLTKEKDMLSTAPRGH